MAAATDMLDVKVWSAREVLELIGHARTAKTRDGLRTLEDWVLETVTRLGNSTE